MYLLYADESGSATDPTQRHFVLAGFCVFERQGYWISRELDAIASRFNPSDPTNVELHGNPMNSGKGIFRRFPKAEREKAIEDALRILTVSHPDNRLFGCVVNKSAISPNDPVGWAFEQLSSRFDHYLARLHSLNNTQRGVLVFDKSTYETTIQSLARDFRTVGHKWGVLRNLAEVPFFIDSRASRLIQLADLIAYSMFRSYEVGDNRFFSIIRNRFDSVGGVNHGLYEKL